MRPVLSGTISPQPPPPQSNTKAVLRRISALRWPPRAKPKPPNASQPTAAPAPACFTSPCPPPTMLYSWAAHSTCSRARSPRLLGGEGLRALAHAQSPAITAGCSSQIFMLIGRGSAILVLQCWFSTVFLLACWWYLLDLQAVVLYLAGSYIAIMLHRLPPFPIVGFSGSRSCPAACLAALSALPSPGVPVFVGCAGGVDAAILAAVPSARIFRAASRHPGALAARSAALVQAVAASSGLLIVCPAEGQGCPVGVRPGAAFSGGGSGSWASCAFAVQLGAGVLVWSSAPLPTWLVSAGFTPAPGWWFRPPVLQAPTLF